MEDKLGVQEEVKPSTHPVTNSSAKVTSTARTSAAQVALTEARQ
jgi:hypothetical protein